VGLVPTYPTNWAWDNLQVSGPMARTAEDVALMLQAMAGPSGHSPMRQSMISRDFVDAVRSGPRLKPLIAYCADPAGIGIDPAIERGCRAAAFGLKDAGAEVEEIDLDLSAGRNAFLALRGLWFVTHMAPRDGVAFGTNVANNVRSGLATTTAEIAAAEQERGRIWQRFQQLFTHADYLVTPCMAVPPFPVEQNYPDTIAGKPMQSYVDWIAPTFVLSLTGLPVASVPCGLDDGGLPIALQIVGRPSAEESVLALAAVLQRQHPIGLPPLTLGH
jgi:amidase